MEDVTDYRIERSTRTRRITIRIGSDGTPIVRAPIRVSRRAIEEAYVSAQDWIRIQQQSVSKKPQLLSATRVYFQGKEYPVHISARRDGTVRLLADSIIVAPLELTKASTLQSLTNWLKNRAIEILTIRLQSTASMMQLWYSGVSFRQQKTRWGSCSNHKHISLNWRLIHAPLKVSDYVLIHELAHTAQMNHGPEFWKIVACFDPEYREHQRWLARYGSTD